MEAFTKFVVLDENGESVGDGGSTEKTAIQSAEIELDGEAGNGFQLCVYEMRNIYKAVSSITLVKK